MSPADVLAVLTKRIDQLEREIQVTLGAIGQMTSKMVLDMTARLNGIAGRVEELERLDQDQGR